MSQRQIAYAVGVVVLAGLAGAGGFYLAQEKTERDRIEAFEARQREEQRAQDVERRLVGEERKKLEGALKAQQARVDALLQQLATAKDDTERAAIAKALEAEREKMKALSGGGKQKPGCKCTPGDPLCSCD